MKTFTDASGEVWTLNIDIPTARRLKSTNVLDVFAPDALQKICADPMAFADLLYETVRPQAIVKDVSQETFGGLLKNCFVAATEAWFAELRDFFRSLGKDALAAVVDRLVAMLGRMNEAGTAQANSPKVDAAIEKLIAKQQADFDAALDRISGPLSGTTPDSSVSATSPE